MFFLNSFNIIKLEENKEYKHFSLNQKHQNKYVSNIKLFKFFLVIKKSAEK